MDTWKYFGITHADHVVCNPTSAERFDELVGLVELAPGARVWEAACGKGELLIRLAERYGRQGIGVDASPYELAVARERAAARVPSADLRFVEGDAAQVPPVPAGVDLAACLGASWIWGGHRGTLRALRGYARPGGLVLVGEPHWRREPEPAYLAAAGLASAEFSTLHGNIQVAAEEGLTLLYALPSRDEDWDRYEFLQLRAAERYALAHPEDPDVPGSGPLRPRQRHLPRWGRDTSAGRSSSSASRLIGEEARRAVVVRQELGPYSEPPTFSCSANAAPMAVTFAKPRRELVHGAPRAESIRSPPWGARRSSQHTASTGPRGPAKAVEPAHPRTPWLHAERARSGPGQEGPRSLHTSYQSTTHRRVP